MIGDRIGSVIRNLKKLMIGSEIGLVTFFDRDNTCGEVSLYEVGNIKECCNLGKPQ